MIADLGYTLLLIALTASLGSMFLPVLAVKVTRLSVERYVSFATYVTGGALTVAFACLIFLHVVSDFSVVHVVKYSHQLKPMLYKITGVWGNHEGSMLLWVWILSLYGMAYVVWSKMEAPVKSKVFIVLHAIMSGFLLFVILTSNPFIQMDGAIATEGLGLNPLLQDIGLAIHPPTLYVGYVGAGLLFSVMIAALWQGEFTKAWAQDIKPFLFVAWTFLTLGVGLGSWWAYRELGWGGFWFWDPVENVSLLPWLSMTAMLHSLVVVEKRNSLKAWTVFLGIITFAYSVIGAFLVRSGILTSVHAFAEDSSRGVWILILFVLWSGVGFISFMLRGSKLYQVPDFNVKSKEGFILLNNVLLLVLSLVVLLGTLYPIILEVVSGVKVTVGSPYYNISFNSIAVWLLGLAVITPVMKWKKSELLEKGSKQLLFLAISSIYGGLIWWYDKDKFWVIYVAVTLSVWLILSMTALWCQRIAIGSCCWDQMVGNLKKVPASFHAMVVAHIGVAFMVLGIACTSGWSVEKEMVINEGESISIEHIEASLEKVENFAQDNYIGRRGNFRIVENGRELGVVKPELRFYPVEQQQTTEASIQSSVWYDLYAVIGEYEKDRGYAARLYVKPMISWIWFGVILMGIGGIISFIGSRR